MLKKSQVCTSSETQGQIVGTMERLNKRKNMAQKKIKEQPEEPLGTMSYQTSSKRSLPFWLLIGARKLGHDPFNQNSNRSDRENWSTSKGGPVFSKLFRLDRTDPLSFGPKFSEILVEWIAPLVFFWHQSEARKAATIWNWSGKTLSPGALLAVLYFSLCLTFPLV